MKILVQGKLYVTSEAIYFHSYFNDNLLFGKETKIKICYPEIHKIKKAVAALIFDTSLMIEMKNGNTLMFSSFISRNTCFDLIVDVMEQTLSFQEMMAMVEEEDLDQSCF